MPSVLVLSHEEQLDRLRRDCPEAVQRAIIAGDICFDQLVSSRVLRASYRRALGVTPAQKLVVVSSTWGRESLHGKHPRLASGLAECLPVDEFRIVLALHPNIWFGHSPWQVQQWLAGCRHRGVGVLRDLNAWRAALVAADLVVGDHGSVPFYGAALGHPLLLATAPAHTVDPESPVAALLDAAPLLDPGDDLAGQVRRVIAEHSPDRYSAITQLVTSAPGQAAALLRAAMYRVLRLPEPWHEPEPDLLPLPDRILTGTESHLVQVTVDGRRSARLTRYPAELLRSSRMVPRGCHLAVGVAEPRPRWLELADVIVGTGGGDTAHWIAETLASLPGSLVAAAPDSATEWLLGDRSGALLTVSAADTAGRLFASVAYRMLAGGGHVESLHGEWTLTVGGESHRVPVRILRSAG